MKSFDQLVADAESQPFKGWDFSYLRDRLIEDPAPWDYHNIVSRLLLEAKSLVDLGTGGGELLSSFRYLPQSTTATEGYPPNVPLAKLKLGPIGVEVIETFCDDNTCTPQRGALPFKGGAIDVVINRHESFIASEVFRVLRPFGWFVTEQVGPSYYPELYAFLGVKEIRCGTEWNLREAVKQIEGAGLKVTDSREATLEARFLDVGAVVYYLKAVQDAIPNLSSKNFDKLRELDMQIREKGSFKATFQLFFLQATKIRL